MKKKAGSKGKSSNVKSKAASAKGKATRYKHQINSITDTIKPRRPEGDKQEDKGK